MVRPDCDTWSGHDTQAEPSEVLGVTLSTADLEMTQVVKQTRAPLDITLRDRLIIGVLDVLLLHGA